MILKAVPCCLVPLIVLVGCQTGPPPAGSNPTELALCPSSPNCVSSQAEPTDDRHYVEPLYRSGATDEDWQQLLQLISSMRGATVERYNDTYLHATFRSRLFRFVDDVELLRDQDGRIDVRSASRVGYSDLGANRKRVAQIRQQLNTGTADSGS